MRFPYHGAGIALVLGNKVLMGRRSTTPFKGTWCVPGGGREVDIDSNELSTAVRELREETGLDLYKLDAKQLCFWSIRIPFFSWTTFFFRIQSCNQKLVPHEFYELQWLDIDEILKGKDKKKHFRPFTRSEVRSLISNL